MSCFDLHLIGTNKLFVPIYEYKKLIFPFSTEHFAGKPKSGAEQRLQRRQPGEKTAIARYVRSARAARVQHRPVAISDDK